MGLRLNNLAKTAVELESLERLLTSGKSIYAYAVSVCPLLTDEELNNEHRVLQQYFSSHKFSLLPRLERHRGNTTERRILIFCSGGIGDTLQIAPIAEKLRQTYAPCVIFVCGTSSRQVHTLRYFPFIDEAGFISQNRQQRAKLIKALRRIDLFDLIVDWSYVSIPYEGNGGRIPVAKKILKEKEVLLHLANCGPYLDHYLVEKLVAEGINRTQASFTLLSELAPLPTSPFPILDEHLSVLQGFNLVSEKYITCTAGYGRNDNSRELSTKTPPLPLFNKCLTEIKNGTGAKIVSLGSCDDPMLDCDLDLRGRTSLGQTTAILKNAALHIGPEGGLVHLAKTVGTKSLVFFGPTPEKFFGYADNYNVHLPSESSCRSCWWQTENWLTECAAGTHECLTEPRLYAQASRVAQEHLSEKPTKDKVQIKQADLFLEIAQQDVTLLNDLLTRNISYFPDTSAVLIDKATLGKSHIFTSNRMYIHGSKQWEYPKILSAFSAKGRSIDAGGGRGLLSFDLAVTQGRDHHLYDINFNWDTQNIHGVWWFEQNMRNYRYASIYNLPEGDNAVDTVLCASVLEHVQHHKKGLQELLRVTKPDGDVLLTFDITTRRHFDKVSCGLRNNIFTVDSLNDCLREWGEKCPWAERDIEDSIEAAQRNAIYGIPYGLTFGFLHLKKRQVPRPMVQSAP